MPSKSVPGWTQVPVTADMLLAIHYDRLNAAGTIMQITVTYEIRDTLGAVRQLATLSQQVGAYPVAVATILSSINSAQGT